MLSVTGIIGGPAARALSRAGHMVYGMTRSALQANRLAANEVFPVIGDPACPRDWIDIVHNIDIVIDAVGGENSATIAPSLHKAVSDAAARRPPGTPPLTYIYTSGMWVHGDDRATIVTDGSPIVSPLQLVAWRPAVEDAILRSSGAVRGIVIRPGLLYGRGGSLFAPLFASAEKGNIVWPGAPGGQYATVHADDLADLYVRVVGHAAALGGLVFDATREHSESVDLLLLRMTEVSSAERYEYKKPTNLLEEALSATIIARPTLARTMLGWESHKPDLVDGLEMYYAAWKARKGEVAD